MDASRDSPGPLLQALEYAANRLLDMDPERRSELGALAGKAIAIDFRDRGSRLFLLPRSDGLDLAAAHEGPVHVTIRGAPRDMLAYLAGAAPAAGGGLEIAGDVGVADRLQGILKDLDPDWEESLSRWVGDVAARRLGNAVRGVVGWARAAAQSTAQDFDEYLRFEARAVPERDEVARFNDAVDRLRDDVERLRARLERLHRRAAAGQR
jgi:ubiquinone biosynthesis protein UbiJ